MRSRGTQWAYTSTSFWQAARPDSVWWEPISTRSGSNKSLIAVPSAKNSGFESTSKWMPLSFEFKMRSMAAAVRTGSVDFSTMIFPSSAISKMLRAVFSQYWRSDAFPAPCPKVFVGVLTETKIISASLMADGMSVLKNKFRPRARFTTSSKPGSKIGRFSLFQASMRDWLISTTVTLTSGHLSAITVIVGPPT